MKPPYPDDWLLIEGLMTTLAPDPPPGAEPDINLAPMGPIVDPSLRRFVFRPFKTSTTYRNLKTTGEGVFHVTDDALMIARGAIGTLRPADVELRPAARVRGRIVAGACRYYELRVTELDDREERTTIRAEAMAAGTLREFIGFNRAKHAVIEAAILATRLHLTGAEPVLAELDRLQVIVDKTGAAAEHQAMRELREYVAASAAAR